MLREDMSDLIFIVFFVGPKEGKQTRKLFSYLVAEALLIKYIDLSGGICWQHCKDCDTVDYTESSVWILVECMDLCFNDGDLCHPSSEFLPKPWRSGKCKCIHE